MYFIDLFVVGVVVVDNFSALNMGGLDMKCVKTTLERFRTNSIFEHREKQ